MKTPRATKTVFSKGDHARYTTEELNAVAATLNGRPRKSLGWRTPAEALQNHLQLLRDNNDHLSLGWLP